MTKQQKSSTIRRGTFCDICGVGYHHRDQCDPDEKIDMPLSEVIVRDRRPMHGYRVGGIEVETEGYFCDEHFEQIVKLMGISEGLAKTRGKPTFH